MRSNAEAIRHFNTWREAGVSLHEADSIVNGRHDADAADDAQTSCRMRSCVIIARVK